MEDAEDGNDSLSIEHKEEMHIFHKFMDLLTSRNTAWIEDSNFTELRPWGFFTTKEKVLKVIPSHGLTYIL